MIQREILFATPAQGRGDMRKGKRNGAILAPFLFLKAVVMPALSRHRAIVAAFLFAPLFLHAQTYFQQRVDYTIDVQLNDNTNDLQAMEQFVYTINSPQALDTIWMHLWPNAYKDRTTALCHQLDLGGRFGLHLAE